MYDRSITSSCGFLWISWLLLWSRSRVRKLSWSLLSTIAIRSSNTVFRLRSIRYLHDGLNYICTNIRSWSTCAHSIFWKNMRLPRKCQGLIWGYILSMASSALGTESPTLEEWELPRHSVCLITTLINPQSWKIFAIKDSRMTWSIFEMGKLYSIN